MGVDGVVTEMHGRLHPEGDFKKTKLKATWVAETEFSIPVQMFEFDHLITKKKLDDGDDINDFLTSKKNPTEQISAMTGEAALRLLRVNDKIQIERRGFFRVDKPYKEEAHWTCFSSQMARNGPCPRWRPQLLRSR